MGKNCVPPVAMVFLQLGFAGMNVVSKLALDAGMSPYVLIAYRNLIAAAVISPVAYFFERYVPLSPIMHRCTICCMLIVVIIFLIGSEFQYVHLVYCTLVPSFQCAHAQHTRPLHAGSNQFIRSTFQCLASLLVR